MIALITCWLIMFGVLNYVAWPLLVDDDTGGEDGECCRHCGCSAAELCEECYRELGSDGG